jgi:hypothetical protein
MNNKPPKESNQLSLHLEQTFGGSVTVEPCTRTNNIILFPKHTTPHSQSEFREKILQDLLRNHVIID